LLIRVFGAWFSLAMGVPRCNEHTGPQYDGASAQMREK
jgi:hypothetical protein